jgi:hypothetical protein
MRTATTELATTNNHDPTHLGFRLLRCCTAKATSSDSSTCIRDRESRSSEPSSSVILHREWATKVFEKRSSRLLTQFFKFFITTRLPRGSSPSTRSPSARSSSLSNCRHQGTVCHVQFLLSNHILHIEYVDLCMHDFAR